MTDRAKSHRHTAIYIYIYMWAKLLLLVSLFAESTELVVGGKQTNVLWVPGRLWAGPLWAGPLWAGHLWAPLGPYGPALMGQAIMGPLGP